MILKGFKVKSNKKYINSQLENRVVIESNTKIAHVGIIFNADELVAKPDFSGLAEALNISEDKIKIIAFKAKLNPKERTFYPTFSLKAIGRKGVIKDGTLRHLLEIEYDALISYYEQDLTPLKLLTVVSKAKFKIGILQKDERINDLIIKTGIYDIKTFTSELKKYLTILNKV